MTVVGIRMMKCTQAVQGFLITVRLYHNLRNEKGEKGGLEARRAYLAGVHTDILMERELLCTSLLLCPSKVFRQENKNALSF